MLDEKYYNIRTSLSKVNQAISRKKIKIGFLGGSITEQSAKHNYSDIFTAELKYHYPDIFVETQNLAIGATCSTLGCLLAKQVLDDDLDLVIIEYAVNDDSMDPDLRMRAREGIVQIIKERLKADIFFVYTYKESMYSYYSKDENTELPQTIKDFEKLAQNYSISSCNVGMYAFDQMMDGRIRFEEWLPDNLHPSYRGSALYAECLMGAFLKNLSFVDLELKKIEEPKVLSDHFGNLKTINFENLKLQGPWIVKETHEKWIGKFLYTTSIQAKITFEIEANCVVIGTLFGEMISDIYYSINGSETYLLERVNEDWTGEQGWYREDVLYCGKQKKLTITLSFKKNPEHLGTTTIIPHIYYL